MDDGLVGRVSDLGVKIGRHTTETLQHALTDRLEVGRFGGRDIGRPGLIEALINRRHVTAEMGQFPIKTGELLIGCGRKPIHGP